ncbi:MAG TPA: nucleoside triphosphate pyrophosphohydrolase [Deltaproteobacteria bacterium]|nr:nucleoside triphosphate pyrophosphohydrolase [Deltaproteobacteria bacterium]
MEGLLTELVGLVSTLRGEHGCPWDKKQTMEGFRTFLVEEVYELIDAIDKKEYESIRGELGDLLFHIVFIARICEERNLFCMAEVLSEIIAKMRKRHPHVFGPNEDRSGSVEQRWEQIKKEEDKDYSPLSGVPSILPALSRAYLISRRAAKLGFDWDSIEAVYGKLEEELAELKEAQTSGGPKHIEEEIGDILFTVVNLSRFHKIDPEAALRGTIDKFIRRFAYIEQATNVETSDMKTMDALWDEAKKKEKKGPEGPFG